MKSRKTYFKSNIHYILDKEFELITYRRDYNEKTKDFVISYVLRMNDHEILVSKFQLWYIDLSQDDDFYDVWDMIICDNQNDYNLPKINDKYKLLNYKKIAKIIWDTKRKEFRNENIQK